MEGNSSGEGPSSPKNKVKFLCSQGGKILPRPSDGQLKYVGGETRVVAVSRTISFSELKKKLNSMFEGNMVLKYQLIPDELDALVSVKCDEDLKHMLEEYDRQEAKASSSTGVSPLLRAFLFPPTPFLINDNHHSPISTHNIHANTTNDSSAMEQRYIDAINGFVRSSTQFQAPATAPNNNANIGGRPIFSISSAGSSPKSVIAPDPPETICQDAATVVMCDSIGNPPARPFGANRSFSMHDMHKVHSSPNLLSLSHQQQQQQNQLHQQQHHHYYQQQSRLPRPPVTTSMAAAGDVGACHMGPPHSRFYPPASHQKLSGACSGDGWKAYQTGSGVSDADTASQCSMRQVGGEGFRWNHGLVDYRDRL
ncbi:hypothetical protein AAC387_Pa04g2407 [Persea americana]